MQSNQAVISAFKSSLKKRTPEHQQYLNNQARKQFNKALSGFEQIYGEKPNTVFMSKFLLNCVVPNATSVIKTKESDGSCCIYYAGVRIVPTRVNMIVASLCSTPDTVQANLQEINNTQYDIIKSIDAQYLKSRC